MPPSSQVAPSSGDGQRQASAERGGREEGSDADSGWSDSEPEDGGGVNAEGVGVAKGGPENRDGNLRPRGGGEEGQLNLLIMLFGNRTLILDDVY